MPQNDIRAPYKGIFNTYKPLTKPALCENMKVVGLAIALLLLFAGGVAIAVKTGIVWLAIIGAGVSVSVYYIVAQKCKLHYTERFGAGYNYLLRMLVGGFLVYGGSSYRGLWGIYERLHVVEGYDFSFGTFAWTTFGVAALVFATCNVSLNYIRNVRLADVLGLMEVVAVGVGFGALFALILYT